MLDRTFARIMCVGLIPIIGHGFRWRECKPQVMTQRLSPVDVPRQIDGVDCLRFGSNDNRIDAGRFSSTGRRVAVSVSSCGPASGAPGPT